MLTHRFPSILGNIPGDWQAKPLRRLLRDQFSGDWGEDEGETAVSVLRSTNFTNDGPLDMSDVATRYFPTTIAKSFGLKAGDILVERSGGGPDQPVGRIGFIDEEMPGTWVSNFVHVLRPDPTKVDSRFLGWVLFELQRTGLVERVQQQSTQMRNLNWREYQRLLLPWPEPDEQRRIAAALKHADEAINRARKERDAALELGKTLVHQLLEIGLPGRHHGFSRTKYWSAPGSWDVVRVKLLLSDMDAGSSPLCEAEPAKPGAWGVLKVSAVTWDRFEEMENKALPLNIEPQLSEEVRVGDIIVTRANTTELCGAINRVHSLYTRLLLCDKTWRLQPKEDVNPDWLVAVLKHPNSRKQIEANATGTSDSMKNIGKRDFRNIVVPRPPKDEQDEIARILVAVDRQVEAHASQIAALQETKRSLLHGLLAGTVRIAREGVCA